MNAQRIGAFSAKNQFSQLLARVQRGQSYVVTRRGKAVARLGPVGSASKAEDESLLATARRLRARSRAGVESLKQLIDEGRRH